MLTRRAYTQACVRATQVRSPSNATRGSVATAPRFWGKKVGSREKPTRAARISAATALHAHPPTHPHTHPPTHLPAQPAGQPATHPPTHTPLQHLASEERKMDPRKSARTHHGPQPPQHLASGERKMDPGKSRHTPHGSQPLQHLASEERKIDPRLQASARHRKHSRRSTSLLMNKSWTREKYTHTARIDALHRFA